MASIDDYLKSKPPPPPHLNKENVGVWIGWHHKGDREIAREAVTKGIHELGVLYLSLRNKQIPEETHKYFKEEVMVWVMELLGRKQIFKVSHILQNIGVDPNDELLKVFYSTTDKELREYTGNHLKSQNRVDDKMQLLWHFLDLIINNNVLIPKFKLTDESIEYLGNQNDEWKSEVASKLFLRTHDNSILCFLNGDALWKQLLFYSDIKLIKIWIDCTYGEFANEKDVHENLENTFRTFPITNNMINQLDAFPNIQDIILDHLCIFAIFSKNERYSLKKILLRVAKATNIENIMEIIRKDTSNLTEESFFQLLIDYCERNYLPTVLSSCVEHFTINEIMERNYKDLALISDFKKLNFCNEVALKYNIFQVCKYFSAHIDNYLNNSPTILLSLLMFSKNLNYEEIYRTKSVVLMDTRLTDSVTNLFDDYKMLRAICERATVVQSSCLTYYILLEKQYGVNVKELYAWHFNESPMPNFQTPELMDAIGYKKKVNHFFYLQDQRPSYAARHFLIESYKHDNCLTEDNIKIIQRKIYKIAMKNIDSIEVSASCVAFLEIIGLSSYYLRVALEAAKILLQSSEDISYVTKLFLNIENDPHLVLNDLEAVVIERIDFEKLGSGSGFIGALKVYDIVVDFAKCYNIKPPLGFLKACAFHNLWLPFLIFAQIKAYPIEQVKISTQSFKNPTLLEHIIHNVTHDIQVEDPNTLMRERDSRKYFLSRIGVRKSVESLTQSESAYSSKTSQSSYGSNVSSTTSSDFLEIDVSNTKATLLQTLIRCHDSRDPPRALLQACQHYKYPLLAIFATLYEPDSVITNWLTWLAVSTNLYETFTNFETLVVCPQSVAALLVDAMKHQFPKTLLESFEIFLPDNPLRYMIEFLNMCIDKNFEKIPLLLNLEAFKQSLQKCRRFSVLSENDREMTYLNNNVWIAQTCLQLLSYTVECNMFSLYEQWEILAALDDVGFENFVRCPNIKNLLKIMAIVIESRSIVNFNILLYFDQNEREAVLDCIDALLEQNLFEYALKVAQIESLPLDRIILQKWHYFYQTKADQCDFWQKSNAEFISFNITADCVVEYFLTYIDKTENILERYNLIKLAHEWARKYSLSSKYDLEKRKWLIYVDLDDKSPVDNEFFKNLPSNVTFKEMTEMLAQISEYEDDISADKLNSLTSILNEALDNGYLWVALKLEKMFGCITADLATLKVSYSLAEGLMLPYQLNTQQRLLITKGAHFKRYSHRRTLLSSRLSSFSSAHSPANISYLPSTVEVNEQSFEDTLTILCTLAEKIQHGSELAHSVYMAYRISVNIEIPYQVIVSNTDSMKLLKDALEDDCVNKLEVVHDFIHVFKWSKAQIADFICEEIITSAETYLKSKTALYLMWDLKMDNEFHLVLQLLQENSSLLGNKIYSYASASHKAQVVANLDFRISELALVIELLIKAHDCFTADCNMEGITIILKKCRTVISHLLTLRSWKLIVRLLTGIRRYTEMNYVFQMLKENDQFEYLLRRGSNQDSALKTALLEFLRKHCPDNGDLYKIVALHFALFSEVAMLWEREAQSVIRNLIAISRLEMQNFRLNPETEPYIIFTNTDGTKLCLNKAMENYTHATEFHLQGEKLGKAMNSAKQAELIALQLSFFKGLPSAGTATCLLNLNKTQLYNLISGPLSFEQSSILVKSYNYQPDWSSVLFEQCVMNNNHRYLEDFTKKESLTDSLVSDIARKFTTANINTIDEIKSMKTILEKLISVHTKYRLASELGFMDIVEELIQGEQLAYLKDTVWKKGYKQ